MRQHVMRGDGSGTQAGTGLGGEAAGGPLTPQGPAAAVLGGPRGGGGSPGGLLCPQDRGADEEWDFLLEAGWTQEHCAALGPLPLARGSGQPRSS